MKEGSEFFCSTEMILTGTAEGKKFKGGKKAQLIWHQISYQRISSFSAMQKREIKSPKPVCQRTKRGVGTEYWIRSSHVRNQQSIQIVSHMNPDRSYLETESSSTGLINNWNIYWYQIGD